MLLAWVLFFIWRKTVERADITIVKIVDDSMFFFGVLIIPVVWCLLFAALGGYEKIIFASRLHTFLETIQAVLIGSIGLLTLVIHDDLTLQYKSYVEIFLISIFINLSILLMFRMSILSLIKRAYHTGGLDLIRVSIGDTNVSPISYTIRTMAEFKEFKNRHGEMDELFFSHHKDVHSFLAYAHGNFPRALFKVHYELIDRLPPNFRWSPSVHASHYDITQQYMGHPSRTFKRLGDVIAATIGLVIFAPLMIYAAIRIKRDSTGPVFYRQLRIGQFGRPFTMIKLRSMYDNAEDDGIQLSVAGDPRCTPWGRIMRKWRIDELPQMMHVLLGQMSIVGPRPERQYYIDQIVEQVPEYYYLHALKPGITSWGQMRYGYASNVAEMIQRLRFDLLYVQHPSLLLDVKIILLTLYKLFSGRLN